MLLLGCMSQRACWRPEEGTSKKSLQAGTVGSGSECNFSKWESNLVALNHWYHSGFMQECELSGMRPWVTPLHVGLGWTGKP